jgi:hypothetical protein
MGDDHIVLYAFAGGAAALIGATLLGLIKQTASSITGFLSSLFVETKEIGDSNALTMLMAYLSDHAFSIANSKETLDVNYFWIKPKDRWGHVFSFSKAQNHSIFLYQGAPLWCTPSESGGDRRPEKKASVHHLRGTVNWKKLLLAAAEYHEVKSQENQKFAQATKRFEIVVHTGKGDKKEGDSSSAPPRSYKGQMIDRPMASWWSNWKFIGYGPNDLGKDEDERPMLERLSLAPVQLQIVKDVRFWKRHKEWHKERGIPWRRGLALYGAPGDGKSALIRAIAEDLDMPVHVFNLATMNDQELIGFWNQSKVGGDRIAVFEDFDTVFHGRTNVSKGGSIDFQTLLNLIDGIEREDGLLLFLTTNQLDKFDSALGIPDPITGISSRPGRIDVLYQIPHPDYDGRLKMAYNIIGKCEEAEELCKIYTSDTAAQFQERCSQFAKKILWGEVE